MLGEETVTPRIDRQHQCVVFRGQRLGERRRNFTQMQNGGAHRTRPFVFVGSITSSSRRRLLPSLVVPTTLVRQQYADEH
jgi:hypothetical protein